VPLGLAAALVLGLSMSVSWNIALLLLRYRGLFGFSR
jgi:hypothetical protein